MQGTSSEHKPNKAFTLLFVDNNPAFLETRAEFLEDAGYRVLRAVSLEEAQGIMEREPIDLAVLDVRMVEDDDTKDVSGILLAREERYAPIPKIILTDYPDYTTAREALGPVLEGMPPAVDYLAKKEGPEAMVQRVGEALARFAPMNQKLIMRWTEGLSLPALTGKLNPDLSEQLGNRSRELEKLLRRFYTDAQQVTLGPVYTQGDGYVYLACSVIGPRNGDQRREVVMCARRTVGENEEDRYTTFVPDKSDPGAIVLHGVGRSVHYILRAYHLVGAHESSVRPLVQALPVLSTQQTEAVLDTLFAITLNRWHGRGQTPADLPSVVAHFLGSGPQPQDLQKRVASLSSALQRDGIGRLKVEDTMMSLYVDPHRERFPIPWSAWEREYLDLQGHLLQGHIHGQVDLARVLTDRNGGSWLIDFTQARQDFLVLDYINFEMSVRRHLLQAQDLPERFAFERMLVEVTTSVGEDTSSLERVLDCLDEDRPEIDPGRRRGLVCILEVRRQAQVRLGITIHDYLAVLYGYVLQQFWAYDPQIHYTVGELLDFLQDLALLGLLSNALHPAEADADGLPEEARAGLWIDVQNRQVWVQGQTMTLTPQEYTLLTFLYTNRGRLCTPEDITRSLEDEDYEYDKLTDEHRVRSAINRLRRKLEPNPQEPRFLLTVRGHGYKLEA